MIIISHIHIDFRISCKQVYQIFCETHDKVDIIFGKTTLLLIILKGNWL